LLGLMLYTAASAIRTTYRPLLRIDGWGIHVRDLRGRLFLPWPALVAIEITRDRLWAWPVAGSALTGERGFVRRWDGIRAAACVTDLRNVSGSPGQVYDALRRHCPRYVSVR